MSGLINGSSNNQAIPVTDDPPKRYRRASVWSKRKSGSDESINEPVKHPTILKHDDHELDYNPNEDQDDRNYPREKLVTSGGENPKKVSINETPEFQLAPPTPPLIDQQSSINEVSLPETRPYPIQKLPPNYKQPKPSLPFSSSEQPQAELKIQDQLSFNTGNYTATGMITPGYSTTANIASEEPYIPPGFEFLIPLDHVFVKYRDKVPDAVTPDPDIIHAMDIFDGFGQRIYHASESVTLGVGFGSSSASKQYTITISDFQGKVVLTLTKISNLVTRNSTMTVVLPNGSLLGQVILTGKFSSELTITDGVGKIIMILHGQRGCGPCPCRKATDFPIVTYRGDPLGIIRKNFIGKIEDRYKDKDNFGAEFPQDLEVHWKALVFAAVFLIDFLYFGQEFPKSRKFDISKS